MVKEGVRDDLLSDELDRGRKAIQRVKELDEELSRARDALVRYRHHVYAADEEGKRARATVESLKLALYDLERDTALRAFTASATAVNYAAAYAAAETRKKLLCCGVNPLEADAERASRALSGRSHLVSVAAHAAATVEMAERKAAAAHHLSARSGQSAGHRAGRTRANRTEHAADHRIGFAGALTPAALREDSEIAGAKRAIANEQAHSLSTLSTTLSTSGLRRLIPEVNLPQRF